MFWQNLEFFLFSRKYECVCKFIKLLLEKLQKQPNRNAKYSLPETNFIIGVQPFFLASTKMWPKSPKKKSNYGLCSRGNSKQFLRISTWNGCTNNARDSFPFSNDTENTEKIQTFWEKFPRAEKDGLRNKNFFRQELLKRRKIINLEPAAICSKTLLVFIFNKWNLICGAERV